DQDQPRSRLVVVELRQEGAEHLTRTERAVGLREIGAVAPVLPGAEEEHLHAEEAALLMHGEHVRLLNAARIDALMRLHGRERGKAVAVDRGALVVQRGGGFLHLGRELLLHPAAAPGEKVVGLAHQLLVIGEFDLACAWARAALDLVEQARPRAALEKTIRAGAQQERALQGRDGTVDRPYRRERPVVAARPGAGAAVLEDLRRPVVAGDQYIRERLVVAQQHVEARPQPLDQVGFEQQRLGLGRGRDEFERGGRRNHALDARIVAGRPSVGEDALADALGLADVEHVAVGVDHAIDARAGGRVAGVAHDRLAAGRERPGRGREVDRGLALDLGQALLFVFLDEFGRWIDVFFAAAHGPKIRSTHGEWNVDRTAPARDFLKVT